jgi:hypothetical protein
MKKRAKMLQNSFGLLFLFLYEPLEHSELQQAFPNTLLAFCLDTKKRGKVGATGLTSSQEKAGACPNRMLALYNLRG